LIEFNYNKNTNKLLFKCEPELFNAVREFFSVENPNAKFLRKRNKFIPLRKYAITPTGQCDLGLFWEIRRYLIDKQIPTAVNISEDLTRIFTPVNTDNIFTNFSHTLRDYQLEVIEKAIKTGTGTCVLGTGAGKTLTTAALIENFFRSSKNKDTFKCLVIVPDLGLVSQTYNEFIDCGTSFKISKWTGSNKCDYTANVIICNIGILQSQFTENDWVRFIDLLIVDECHKIKSDNKISKIIGKIKTYHRYGFTGTLPEDQFDKWSIIGKLGPVIYEKSSYNLRIEKFLTSVEVKVLNLSYNESVPKLTDNDYRNELEFIYSNNKRNTFITSLCLKLQSNTLILVNHIAHGESLLSYFETLNTNSHKVFFIRGDVEVEERDRIKKIMESNNNIICIAISAIFSTGVNIKNLHNIVFAAGGKSFIRTVQSIGRGLRLHEGKEKLLILDLCDNLHYGNKHSDKRKQIYTKEQIKFIDKQIKLY
jgi:superfamily II DNA or RNA helicase